jgi:TolB protein
MRMWSRRGAVGVVLAVMLGLPVTSGGATGAGPTIVFDSALTGRFELYSQATGGGASVLVSDAPGADFGAAVSPAGRQLVFARRVNGNYDLYTVPVAGGSTIVRQTRDPAIDAFPAWSTAGIAFESTRGGPGNYDIYVLQGGHVRRLTSNRAVDGLPTWAPDRLHIAFDSNRNGHFQIMRIPAQGYGVATALTPATSNSVQPAWSPDGKLIAFSGNAGGRYQIYLLDLASMTISQVTNDQADDTQPAWSPDGTHLAYVSNAGGHQRVWTVFAHGANPTQFSTQNGEQPEWLPVTSG